MLIQSDFWLLVPLLKFCADPSGSNGGFMQIARMNVDVYNKGQGGRGAWIMVNAQNTKMRIRVY